MLRRFLASMALCGLAGLPAMCRAQVAEFVVHAGDHDRAGAVVTIELPQAFRNDSQLTLSSGENRNIAVQRTDEAHAQFVLAAPIKKGESAAYRLAAAAQPLEAGTPVKATDDAGAINISTGDRKLLTYNAAPPPLPPAVLEHFLRSGHIHPVYTPAGKVVTDGYPIDIHTHQHGVFHAWTRTTFQGHMVDFWNQHERNGPGTIEHRELVSTTSGPVFAGVRSKLAYVDLSQPGERIDALNEEWNVRVYGVPNGTMFEVETTQTSVGELPLVLQEYTYGGMAIRGAAGWYAQARSGECNALTSEGKDRISGNNTTPNWCDLYGKVDGEVIGIAMFSHPSNPASPQPVRIHNNLPYFVYSPIIKGEITITPDKPYRARYLIFAHDGAPDPAVLDAVWNNYAHPSRVEWKS